MDLLPVALREVVRNIIIDVLTVYLGEDPGLDELARVTFDEIDELNAEMFYDGKPLGRFIITRGADNLEFNVRFNWR